MRDGGRAGWGTRRGAVALGVLGVVALLVLIAGAAAGGLGDAADTGPLPQPTAAPAGGAGTAYGLHMDLTYDRDPVRLRAAVGLAQDLGVQVSRNSLLWHRVEPEPGERDWSHTDRVVDALHEAGIEPLFTVYGSPPWANGVPAGTEDQIHFVPEDEQEFARWLEDYRGFVSEAAARYRGRVHRWEAWNEPNERFFWKPGPDVERYARLYVTFREAIRGADPDAQVAVGGLAGLTASIDMEGLAFLRALDAELARLGADPVDAVAIHPYAGQAQSPDDQVRGENDFGDIARVQRYLEESRAGQGGDIPPLWVTEWGWSTEEVSAEEQADHVQRSMELLRDDYAFVEVATLFIDYDRPPTFFHGIYDADLRPKPAAERFRAFLEAAASDST